MSERREPGPRGEGRDGFGVYVHVPFCVSRCDYCAFATWTDRAHVMDAYVDACVTDLQRRFAAGVPEVTSVYLGGGTPSLLPAAAVARIVDAVPRRDDAEVTVECNPDTVDEAKLAAYRHAGVNRVSVGAQSFVLHVLAALGRSHTPANVGRAVAAAREAGIHSVNVDLIFGASGETLDDWDATVEAARALEPDHVSAYALSVEPGTALAQAVGAGARPAPDDDDQADKYLHADAILEAHGYSWYEISSWARAGYECRHHVLYWSGGEYLGIGCAAHGHTAGRRWWNVGTPERYIARIEGGRTPEGGSETLDLATRRVEELALSLRTRDGIVLDRPPPALAELQSEGLVDVTGRRVVLTRRGRLLGNEVTLRLLDPDAPVVKVDAISTR
jgi:putative oxygen-independent coproporphyrinogen III oxidase